MFKRNRQSGTALLITLLLMGMLMTLTLGISNLVIREISVTQSVVDSAKAFYQAEAGVENALMALNLNYPGFEVDKRVSGEYNYQIVNTSDTVPDFPDDQPIFMCGASVCDSGDAGALANSKDQIFKDYPSQTYRKLGINETHVIPLFTFDSAAETEEVKRFMVQYYTEIRQSDLDKFYSGIKLDNLDVLRWKLYGKPLNQAGGEPQRTESIADFYPSIDGDGPKSPVCIGTDTSAKSLSEENCIFPTIDPVPPNANTSSEEFTALWSAARECYMTDSGAETSGHFLIKGTAVDESEDALRGTCNMYDFIISHKQNYLVLTNMVNPEVIGISDPSEPSQAVRANIYYRVIAYNEAGQDLPKLVKDFADITSTGFANDGKVRKSLHVRYKAPGYLPVFNFSLYKTKSGAST